MLKRLLTRLVIGGAALVAILLTAGWLYQRSAERSDLERYPPPGQLFTVDGTKMHIHCLGEGSPTVILEQGLNGTAAAWDDLHPKMAEETRVCAYDRAGLGYSEPIDRQTSAKQVAERLNELLDQASIDDNLILVGWSAGGLYGRAFQRLYPERVAAMLFIDSSHEEQGRRYPSHPSAGGGRAFLQLASYLAPVGLLRMSGLVEQRFQSYRGSEASKERLVALYLQSHVAGTMLRESDAFDLDLDSDPPTSLGDLPLIVLSQGHPADASIPDSPEEAEYEKRRREVEDELQRELAQLSTQGRQIVATESGHGIHRDQPHLVLDALRELIERVRGEPAPFVGRTADG